MFTRLVSRQILARASLVPSVARVALPIHVGSALAASLSPRFLITETKLAPMDELSAARRKLRQVLEDYRQNK